MQTLPLYRLAKVIRSKNAGPFRFTLDILFDEKDLFDYVKSTGALSRKSIAEAYRIDESLILSDFTFDMGRAFKFTMKRPRVQGDPGDSDIYGAQQHAPLLYLEIPWENNKELEKKLRIEI